MQNECLAKLADFVRGTPELFEELTELDKKFPKFRSGEDDLGVMAFDWFLFDHKLSGSNKTPLRLFIETCVELTDEERDICRAFEDNIYGLFEVTEISIGKRMILKDLSTEREYSVEERTATRHLEKKQCIFTRVLPHKDHYILSGSVRAFPEDATYMIRMGYRRMREKKVDTRLTPRDVVELFSGIETIESPETAEIDGLKRRLGELIVQMGMPRGTLKRTISMIHGGTEPMDVLTEISERTPFHSEEEARKFLDILVALWNNLPQQVIGGLSPEEKEKESPKGPQESALIVELADHVNDVVDLDSYSSQEDCDRAIDAVQREWLDTPNPDLDGQSPREVILAERRSAGNPRSEITVRVRTRPVRILTKRERKADDLYDEAMKLSKEDRYEEAIKKYEQHLDIIPENHIAWGNMGILHALLLDKKEALRCLHRSLSIKPDYKIARDNLELLEGSTKRDLKRMAEQYRRSKNR